MSMDEQPESDDAKALSLDEQFLKLSDAYLVDLECLREMFGVVLLYWRLNDVERNDKVSQFFSKPRIQEQITRQETERRKLRTTDAPTEESEEKAKSESFTFQISASEAAVLFADLQKLRRAETLFRQHSVVALVSRFDEFISGILYSVLRSHPEWLRASEKT